MAEQELVKPKSVCKSEQRFGVNAVGVKLGELVDHALAVGAVGHAKPFALSGKHTYCGGTVTDELVHYRRDEELGFGLVDVPEVRTDYCDDSSWCSRRRSDDSLRHDWHVGGTYLGAESCRFL